MCAFFSVERMVCHWLLCDESHEFKRVFFYAAAPLQIISIPFFYFNPIYETNQSEACKAVSMAHRGTHETNHSCALIGIHMCANYQHLLTSADGEIFTVGFSACDIQPASAPAEAM